MSEPRPVWARRLDAVLSIGFLLGVAALVVTGFPAAVAEGVLIGAAAVWSAVSLATIAREKAADTKPPALSRKEVPGAEIPDVRVGRASYVNLVESQRQESNVRTR